jgi:hypothetical protein
MPGGVTLAEFFDRDGLFAIGLGGRQWAKDIVDRVEEDTPNVVPASEGALAGPNEVVDEDVKGSQAGASSWRGKERIAHRGGVGSSEKWANRGGGR